MRKLLLAAAAIPAIIGAIAAPAAAHRFWMVPSATTVAGTDGWVTIDGAISNDLFYPDHQPMRSPPVVTQPDGTVGKVENFAIGKYRATFDLHLTQAGTWKLAQVNEGLMGSYTLNGAEQRIPRGTAAAGFQLPAGASDAKLTEASNRAELFVTAGAPSAGALKPSGRGLELVPVTHPNDLVAGEPATFRFLADGKPAADLAVTVIAGGSRYRDAAGEMALKTDAKGEVVVKWPGAGMYWMNATAQGAGSRPGVGRRMSYSAVVEVLPS
jgi:uncharacterized GH25 family protein